MKKSALRIIETLADGNFHTSVELAGNYSLDYRKRISELRAAGWIIEGRKVQGKPYFEYRMPGGFGLVPERKVAEVREAQAREADPKAPLQLSLLTS